MELNHFITTSGQEVEISSLTVLVGPNNSGKTQTLQDIRNQFSKKNPDTIIVEDINLDWPDNYEKLVESIDAQMHPQQKDRIVYRGIRADLQGEYTSSIPNSQIGHIFNNNRNRLLDHIGELFVAYIDAASRLDVASQSPGFNPHNDVPANLLHLYFKADDHVKAHFQKAFLDVFRMEIMLDYSGITEWEFRISPDFGDISSNLMKSAGEMSKYRLLDDQGHGFRSFAGVVLSVLLTPDRTILMDEPEAFLHPTQSRQLGDWLSTHTERMDQKIIVATHDQNFISGIVSSDADVRIYRVERSTRDETYFHEVKPFVTRKFAQDSLLSTQRVIESVFHESVVVCEGGDDRAVYSAVANQALDDDNTLFIDALGKHSIHKVTRATKNAHVPSAAIADFDILNDREILKRTLKSTADVDYGEIKHILEKWKKLEAIVEESVRLDNNWNSLKNKGLSGLEEEGKELAKEIIEESKQYGVFVVPVGEIEDWIVDEENDKGWVVNALDKIQDGNCDGSLVKFIEDILLYLRDQRSNALA